MCGGSYFGNTQWMAALSRAPELKAIARLILWADPDDGLWTRGGAIELGITAPWSLMQGADTLMRRHRTDLASGERRHRARTGFGRPGERRLR
ncbi:CocE/NonD family hydrolase [Streptomyces akebiae]|uniref:CocE/NonD family hydrolase n=1 Tax=Streptomyces akebiae TaxID=2865673 RepID=A0ABX8Y6C2_9ACTN|nr:CocE/NonD family hydrolase [Streptomyces akebiae]QYX83534.1 CocE/NonD family hydrolase [Streptomyces akebiae]